jgi:hypothetical protein
MITLLTNASTDFLACGSKVLNDQSVPRCRFRPPGEIGNAVHKNEKVPLRAIRSRYDVNFMFSEALTKTERR